MPGDGSERLFGLYFFSSLGEESGTHRRHALIFAKRLHVCLIPHARANSDRRWQVPPERSELERWSRVFFALPGGYSSSPSCFAACCLFGGVVSVVSNVLHQYTLPLFIVTPLAGNTTAVPRRREKHKGPKLGGQRPPWNDLVDII